MTIYRFVPRRRIADALCDRRLRLSQPAIFNDLYESRGWAQSFGVNEVLRAQIQGLTPSQVGEQCINLMSQFPSVIRTAPRLNIQNLINRIRADAQVARDPSLFARNMLNMISVEINAVIAFDLGVACFSMERTSLIQWTHYAGDHSGIVLAFDDSDPFFAFRFENDPAMRAVNYGPSRPTLDLANSKALAPLFMKSEDWMHENEVRLVLPLSQGTETQKNQSGQLPIVVKEYPATALVGVTLGYRMNGLEQAAIIDFIRDTPGFGSRVQVQFAIPNDRAYGLNFGLPCPGSSATGSRDRIHSLFKDVNP